jgi:hypothetical protein
VVASAGAVRSMKMAVTTALSAVSAVPAAQRRRARGWVFGCDMVDPWTLVNFWQSSGSPRGSRLFAVKLGELNIRSDHYDIWHNVLNLTNPVK